MVATKYESVDSLALLLRYCIEHRCICDQMILKTNIRIQNYISPLKKTSSKSDILG